MKRAHQNEIRSKIVSNQTEYFSKSKSSLIELT